jgi:hypothetical protein
MVDQETYVSAVQAAYDAIEAAHGETIAALVQVLDTTIQSGLIVIPHDRTRAVLVSMMGKAAMSKLCKSLKVDYALIYAEWRKIHALDLKLCEAESSPEPVPPGPGVTGGKVLH